MKKVILGLFIVVMSLFVHAQDVQEAPKHSNVIIIKTKENIDDAFKKVGRLLMNEGYDIESSDKSFYTITTKETKKNYGFMNGGEAWVKFYIEIDSKDSLTNIKLWGKFEKRIIIRNTGMKGSSAKSTWDFMNNLALKYEKGTIEYLIDEGKK